MARPSYFKRQFFIKKNFQRKFILLYALSVSGIIGLATYFLYLQIDTAVEKHLYSTHIKIDRVGDFLVDLLFKANFYTILAVVVVVLVVSLLIFRGINRNFSRMEETFTAMSLGNYSAPYVAGRPFTEIGNLASLIELARTANQSRSEQIKTALDNLEKGLESPDNSASLKAGKEQLDMLLDEISLP